MDTLQPHAKKGKRHKTFTFQCEHCNKTYTVRASIGSRSKSHYCSRACYWEHTAHKETKKCSECNKDIYIIKSQIRATNFCSRACASKYRRKAKITIACLYCGKTFEELPTSHKQTFCSQNCSQSYRVGPNAHNYKGNLVDCTCLFCGSSFQNPEAWVKRGGGKFCSASCRSRHTVEKQGGMVSSIEIAVKEVLESLGESYHHQYRIGKFLVDFYLPDRNLVIEADGDYWHSLEKNKKNDIKKDQYMQEAKINLVRLKESDIRSSCNMLVRSALECFPLIGDIAHHTKEV